MNNTKIILKVKKLPVTTFGLMGEDRPHPIYFRTRFGIHTFFMKFSIDIVILDKKMKVVKIKKSLSPNKFFVWNPKYDHVVELPQGTIESKRIKLGDVVTLITH
jgi:uncharacterized membrane protein (UPF0127 family)